MQEYYVLKLLFTVMLQSSRSYMLKREVPQKWVTLSTIMDLFSRIILRVCWYEVKCFSCKIFFY